jgi:hypothetical protein
MVACDYIDQLALSILASGLVDHDMNPIAFISGLIYASQRISD